MDIWYLIKNQCVDYCNYHLKQLMTGKYLDWKVIKKAGKTSMTLKYTTILIQGLFHSRETFISLQQFLDKLKK